MYTLILLTFMWSDHSANNGHTTTRINSNMTLDQCKAAASSANNNRVIPVDDHNQIRIISICIKDS